MTRDDAATSRETDQGSLLCFLAGAEPGMRRVDTHASIVFLGKDRVLKVKRAVRLPFLDYSTLEKRKRACDEELRVNTAFAPQLYRRVVPITQSEAGIAIDGKGTPVEWAVEMARFDETFGLDRVAATSEIQPALAVALADTIRRAHEPIRAQGHG
jgi:aminoglycoside phosphotransferase family enzyme